MATNVAMDVVLDAMVAQLAAQLVPATGQPITSLKPVHNVQRYMGSEFRTAEGLKRGIAGRTPAVRVRYAGTRKLTTTIGRRVDRVESAFSFIVASDKHHDKDSRKDIIALTESVRNLISSRMWGKQINPMRFQRMDTLRDDEQLMAIALTFTTRHRVDYTIDPGTDTMLETRGSIVNAAVAHTSTPHGPTVTPMGTPGATTWTYGIVGIDAAGLRTLIGTTGSTSTGAATLNGVNFNRLTWAAKAGIVSYEIERLTAGGTPNTIGKIGTTAALTFDDTGLVSLGATPPDSLHVDLHDVFP